MDTQSHYSYKRQIWTPNTTVADNNSFFHSVFGTRDDETKPYFDKHFKSRRMRWANFLTYYKSHCMPVGLANILEQCLPPHDDKVKDKIFAKYISDIIVKSKAVTLEDIPILATVENIKIVVLSKVDRDLNVIIQPDPETGGFYPQANEIPKEEFVLCLEEGSFSRLKPVNVGSLDENLVVETTKASRSLIEEENKTRTSSIIRYKKGGSAGSKGVEFQVSLLSIFLLNVKNKYDNWKLSTENENAGKFDDIVLEWSEGAVLLQAKYRENKNKRITLEELMSVNSSNADFSLPKYFLSYQKIKNRFKVKNIIVCTNAEVNQKALKFLSTHELRCDSALHYEDNTYCFYKVKSNILQDLKLKSLTYLKENSKNKELNESEVNDENLKDFLEHLQLFFKYPSLGDLEEIIENMLSSSDWREKISSKEIYAKLMSWFQQKDGIYLTEIYARAIVADVVRDKYCRTLENYKITFQNNIFNFQDFKKIYHVISRENNLLSVIKIYQTLQKDKAKILFANLEDLTIIDIFELPQYIYLVIILHKRPNRSVVADASKKLTKILENYTYKKVILVTIDDKLMEQIGMRNDDYICIHDMVTFESLSSDTRERLLKKKCIVFQNTSISLEELLQEHIETSGNPLNAELLEKLIKGDKIRVGLRPLDLDQHISKYYIDRTFKREVNTLDEETEDYVRVVEYFPERNIFNVEEKVVLIADSAGMGKSTVLTRLAMTIKESHPHLWLVRIELNEYTRVLRDALRQNKGSIDIIELLDSKINTKLTNALEKFVFSTTGKVVLMLDGVDEISPDYTNLILGILDHCQGARNFAKIFVTTRPHVASKLERILKVKAFILQPFTDDNQVEFLTKYWTQSLGLGAGKKTKCEQYARVLQEKMSSWIKMYRRGENHFTAIPLQVRMLAEIFQENPKSDSLPDWAGCKEFLSGDETEPRLPDRINIIKLYDMLIEKKKEVFLDKGNPSGNAAANKALSELFYDCLAYHRSLALEVILDKKNCRIFKCYQADNKDMEMNLLKIGIVQKVDGKLHFIHRTFAEYFVAKSLIIELQNPDVHFQKFLLNEILVADEYKVVRAFFDDFLNDIVNGLPPDTFNKYKSVAPVEYLKCKNTLIHQLAYEGCVATVQHLLKCVDFKIVNDREVSVLDYCTDESEPERNISEGFLSRVINLLRGPAPKLNDLNILEDLVKRGGVNIKNVQDLTPLHCAAGRGNLDMVKFLIEQGAICDSRSKDGITPLHCAAQNGQLDTIKYLIEIGVDVNIKDKLSITPIHAAADKGTLEAVKLLMDYNADINVTSNIGYTPLHFAAEKDRVGIVKLLVERGAKLNVRDGLGRNELHSVAEWAHLDTVKYLVELGVDVNVSDVNGKVPLHFAATRNKVGTIKFLTQAGAFVNMMDTQGRTPLHLAAWERHLNAVKCLVECGADVTVRARDGRTALDLACSWGSSDTVSFLAELTLPGRRFVNVESNRRTAYT